MSTLLLILTLGHAPVAQRQELPPPSDRLGLTDTPDGGKKKKKKKNGEEKEEE